MRITEVIIPGPGQFELPLQGGSGQAPVASTQAHAFFPELCAQAQQIYNEWDQSDPEMGDPELGSGGICDRIAEAMGGVFSHHGISTHTIGNDDHASIVANFTDGVFEVDIPPSVYEVGGWYNWTKKEGIVFQPQHIVMVRIGRPMTEQEFDQQYLD
jgi:hypothetical protein